MAAEPAGPRVLVVDDQEAIRVLVRRVLTRSGYQVDVAGSTQEARALRPAGYDVLLIDANLGGEPGTALIEELRAADPDTARRCLLVTGGMTDRAPAGVASLSKPFQPADLLSVVDAMRSAARRGRCGQGDTAGSTAGAAGPPPGPGAGGLAAQPATGPLLARIRALRAAERAAVADFLHDGPVQELTAATLSLAMLSRLSPAEARPYADQVRQHLDAAARPIRRFMAESGPEVPAGASLDRQVRRRTGWLPFTPVTVRELGAPAGAPAVITDIVELALHALAGSAPPARADIEVQGRDQATEITFTITPLDGTLVRAEPAAAAAAEAALTGLAAALGGTGQARLGAFPWRARIGLPGRRPAASQPSRPGHGAGTGPA